MPNTPIYPDFPQEEYETRVRRARALMEAHRLDALLVTQWSTYVYFTGHRSPQKPGDKIRPYMFLLPRDGEPAIFVMPFEEGHVRMTSWFQDVAFERPSAAVTATCVSWPSSSSASAMFSARPTLSSTMRTRFVSSAGIVESTPYDDC